MALAATVIYQVQTGGAANNVNGGGFDPAGGTMLTDLAVVDGTTTTPDVHSDTYTFVAGDVGHWLFVQTGVNWLLGWWKITAVAGGVATLAAAIGEGVVYGTPPAANLVPTTVAGCVDGSYVSGTHSGTFTIDYSLGDAAIFAPTDLEMVHDGTTLVSDTGHFTPVMVGNLVHITSGTHLTPDWYKIAAFIDGHSVTLDRDATTDETADHHDGVGRVGGGLNGMNEIVSGNPQIPLVAGNRVFIASGTYTSGAAATVDYTTKDGTATNPIIIRGYQSGQNWAANPTGTNRPLWDMLTRTFLVGDFWSIRNLRWTGTAVVVISGYTPTAGRWASFTNCRGNCTSTVSTRTALQYASRCTDCEFQALRCYAASYIAVAESCYFHDSFVGLYRTTGNFLSTGCIFDSCEYGIAGTTGIDYATNNTFRNCRLAISVTTPASMLLRNIFADCYTALAWSTSTPCVWSDYNLFYNNVEDIAAGSGFGKGPHDVTGTNPNFGSALASGTTGATNGAGTEFTATGLLAGVTTNDTLVILEGGTGATVGVYDITSIAGLPDSVTIGRTAGASKTGITWGIVKGGTTTNMAVDKAAAYTLALPGASTTSYETYGATQHPGVYPAVGKVQDDAGTFGFLGTEYTPTFNLATNDAAVAAAHLAADKVTLNANLDEMIAANDSIRAVYDCDIGTAIGGGGYTYGDEDPDFVLTTADGAGYYHPPAASEVISTATFGHLDAVAGTYDVTNVAAGNIKDGVSIGGVAGTYSPGGTYTEGQAAQYATDQAEVTAKADHLQNTQTICGITGTLDMALYGLLTDYTDPGKAWVVVGHNYTYAGASQVATYPTTEAVQYQQYLEDRESVEDVKGYLYEVTLLGVEGSLTLPDAGYVLTSAWGGPATYGVGSTGSTPTATLTAGSNVYSTVSAFGAAGNSITPTATTAAAQLALDVSAVDAGKADILDTRTILSVTGMLDQDLWVLKTDVIATVWVVTGHDNYVGGSAGTYPTTATSQAAQKVTDAAFLETNKDEIVIADTHILAEFGVTGTAEGGVDPDNIVLPETDEVDGAVEFGWPDNMREGTGVNAATIRTAVGLASANLDDQLAAVAQAGDAMTLTASERTDVADAILGRSVAACEATAAEWSLCTVILACLESSVVDTTWTIKRTDGSTTHKTKTLTTDAEAEPITGVS